MLTQLSVKGLAIIGNISIDFSERLNVITGETGAGKSILIKALGLICGRKAHADIVREGDAFAQVTGIFDVEPEHKVFGVLEASGLQTQVLADDGLLIIRRQISSRGRSSSWINDVPVTLQVLRHIGEALVDILSQHENHRLLDTAQHLAYLDQFVTKNTFLAQYQICYEDVQRILGKIRVLIAQLDVKSREKDYLAYRYAEYVDLAPSQDDYEDAEDYSQTAGQRGADRKLLSAAQSIIDEGYKGRLMSEAFAEVRRLLNHLNTKKLKVPMDEICELIETAESSVNELSFTLGKCLADLDVDEFKLQQARERIAAYRDLMRKLAVKDVKQLVEEGEKIKKELTFIDSAHDLLAELLEDLNAKSITLRKTGDLLRKERQGAFLKVKKAIERELNQLNMKGATLDLNCSAISLSVEAPQLLSVRDEQLVKWHESLEIISSHGRFGPEKVQFMLSSNPGEPAKPLSKIASGGEVSRIMLGIKSVLSSGADTCLMVFDEIDTGISGQTADIVGGKLKKMANRFQVLCISHLPQVAAYANTHFKVEKITKKGRTESTIKALSNAEGMREVARLLSGEAITKPSLDNAKQLIKNARKLS